MNIVFYVPGMPFNGETIAGSSNCEDRSPSTGSGQSLGGSESAGYYLAREMARRGHSVTAFTQIAGHEAGEWEGVRYVPIGPLSREYPFGAEFQRYAGSVPHDVLIGQRVPALFSQTYQSKLNFWWTHDLALRRYLPRIGAQIWNLDGIFAVSRFHRAQVAEVYGIKPEIVHVLRNGIDHALFDRSRDPEAKQAGKKLVYSHRPERGLEHLVRPGGIMAGLAERDPAIRLQVCGYDNTTPEMAPYYEQLRAWATALPNVDWRGALPKGQLAELMCSAWLHVYPTGFQEVSCITAMEEQAAGTPFITNGGAALPETLAGGGVRWIDDLPAGPATLLQAQGRQAQGGAGSGHSPGQGGVDCEAFIRAILSLRDSPGQWRGLHAAALAKAPEYAWGASADALEAVIDETFARRTEQPARMARHLMRTSDIFPLRNYLETLNGEGAADPITERVGGELHACYGFAFEERYAEHYAAYYAYERERGVTYGPEKLEGNPRFEAVSRRVESLVPEGGRVLDYGCAHGHYSINLAKRFPKVHFTGIDFIPSNIATAQKWAADEAVANVAFREGELNALGEDDLYDLIIAAEVAEHVTAPAALVDTLTEHLKPEGRLLLTTPYGPWEAQGFAEHHPWRAHVHHLEEADLRELFGHHPGFSLQAVPAGHTPWGEALGSYITTFRRPEGVGGRVDLGRKFKRQAPRETLSVCMIVKADGDTLAKCLRSVGEVADEIIIGVDMGAEGMGAKSGRAWGIAEEFGAQAFGIKSPIATGFGEARNATIERAAGDWILWIDDDEELIWPERLPKYLRANGYDAYAVKQHHYALEPGGIIKTDLPCRLFRNRRGFRFHGLVHEHPELGINQGAGHVLLLPDIAICHNGYVTEAVRRKRFERNLPLMQRDRELNPERLLGKFLWIRDLAHLNRFEQERTGAVSPRMREQAEQAVALWRELIGRGEVRMAVDALPYYSECANLLTGGGIDYRVEIGAHWLGLGDVNGQPSTSLAGQFMNTGDIRVLMSALADERLKPFEGEYL